MSKIGRKPINITGVSVTIQGNTVTYQGKKASGTHELPDVLKIEKNDESLLIQAARKTSRLNELWGLHRALLANKIIGAQQGFEKKITIVGLGFKAVSQGSKLQLSLGYSHKIDFELPPVVSVEIDKTGQLLTCKSTDKEVLGLVCSKLRALRAPEPYKGTGVAYAQEKIRRKAGKAKSAS